MKLKGMPQPQSLHIFKVYSKSIARKYSLQKNSGKPYSADIGVGVTGSLGTADPKNKDSVPGEVYFAIDYDGETC